MAAAHYLICNGMSPGSAYSMMTPQQAIIRKALLTQAHHDYAKGMNTYSFFKVRDRAMSADMVQSAFIKTWSYLVREGKIDLMKAFLYHILNQLIIDEYRKRKMSSLDALLEKGYEPGTDRSKRVFDILDGKAALLLIRHLPPKYRNVMRMRYAQDLTIKEISLITGQTRNAVAVQAHRGLEKLRLLFHHT